MKMVLFRKAGCITALRCLSKFLVVEHDHMVPSTRPPLRTAAFLLHETHAAHAATDEALMKMQPMIEVSILARRY